MASPVVLVPARALDSRQTRMQPHSIQRYLLTPDRSATVPADLARPDKPVVQTLIAAHGIHPKMGYRFYFVPLLISLFDISIYFC